jgi:hypothetical protein
MSTTGQSEAAQSSRKRGSSACLPLIDAATKDLFRKNAFRITGLPVDATAREEAKHNDKIKQLAELGKDPHTQDAAFPIKPPPGLDEIREAIQKLNDPQKRLIDEFFWFWPQEHGQSKSDPAIQALAKGDSKTAIEIWNGKEESTTDDVVASHNLALVYHIIALDCPLPKKRRTAGRFQGKRNHKNAAPSVITTPPYLSNYHAFWSRLPKAA